MTYAKYMAWKCGIVIGTILLMIGVPSLIYLVTVFFGVDSRLVAFLTAMGTLFLDAFIAVFAIDSITDLIAEYEYGRHQRS